ncbi:hypothetical protein EPD60_06075 [Flaviaesturariibacter flavus]|uniref:DUF5689 domain-containing protein n=1 Tax=Flaviaesturariibacter flavus TaxID=2502780 RepID=A0A4V2NWK9_9BACT|nr:DUF5689 domain-containing protein [Flaviaesturariibacter flavus]TCJ17752.1 hypothetical protein EPD60_06075 [Flaviaesturariibacter flavus]
MLRSFAKPAQALIVLGILASACNKQPVGPTEPDPYDPNNFTTLAYLRSLYTGSDIGVPANTRTIRATVVSNYKNEAAGNFRIQDESGRGINMFLGTSFTDTALLALGKTVDINVNGGTVSTFNGDVQIKNLSATAFTSVNTPMVITPRTATIRQVLDSLQPWASTVVKLENVSLAVGAPGSTGTNVTVTDATGSIVTFVRTTSGITLNSGNAQSLTGYVSIFQNTSGQVTPQIILRTQSDVVTGGSGPVTPGTGIALTGTSPLTIDFNSIGTGQLPTGVSVRTGARADTIGTPATLNQATATSLWKTFTAGFKNYASATGLNQGTDSTTQVGATNRALGFRQTSAIPAGGDPGAAFVFQLANTTGKNLQTMSFQLQSLDTASNVNRATTWMVDYGIGDNPTTFTPVNTVTGSMITGNHVFSNNAITVTLPAALSNQSQKVWIRIVTLAPSTGTNNRGTAAIDDVKFTWN